MSQFIAGLLILALAAVMAWWGIQVASDGWRKMKVKTSDSELIQSVGSDVNDIEKSALAADQRASAQDAAAEIGAGAADEVVADSGVSQSQRACVVEDPTALGCGLVAAHGAFV